MPVTHLQDKAMAKEMKALMDMLAALKARQDEMIAEMKAEREKRKVGREKVREQLQQMKEELAEETGTIKEDAKVPKFASEESKEGEIRGIANQLPEKSQEMMNETSNGVKGKEGKHEEIKDGKEAFDSQVPEVETEENENATVKIIETDSEVTKSQLASIEPSENSCDSEMEEADVQLTQSDPVLQENLPTSQTVCVSYNEDCVDMDSILNQDTSVCKGSDCIHDPGANIGIGSQETEENKHVATAKITKVNCTHDANKLQSGERTVSDLPVHEKSERTESSDCDMKNRNTPENCSGKVFDPEFKRSVYEDVNGFIFKSFDVYCSLLKTVDETGAKTVSVLTTGHERTSFTCVLACAANGDKLKPMIIFKQKTIPKGDFPNDVIICANENGWMCDTIMHEWLQKVFQCRKGSFFQPKGLLIMDSMRAHLLESVKTRCQKLSTTVAMIPGGLTKILQPLDLSGNKSFKAEVRERWEHWMSEGLHTYTKSGKMRRASYGLGWGWVIQLWQSTRGLSA
ncbi:Pogo transposable element with KRAB, partial [Stegodyphus mimosarum]